jgi:hypothetical protein
MNNFFKSFSIYYKTTDFTSFVCWAFPIGTLLFIWLATTIGVKIFNRRKQMKKIFIINRGWIISSMSAACILISLICLWWSKNFFADHPYQLPLLVSLTIAMLIPVVALFKLLPYFSPETIKEITDQPKTAHQLNSVIIHTKKAFRRNKIYFLIPVLGFVFLFFYLYKGINLISLVFDNSGSMTQTTALAALSETFDKLDKNNEIVLTTLKGPNYKSDADVRKSMNDLMKEKKYSNLNAGNVAAFQNPAEAKDAISQITGFDCCSPICESIWKSYLFIRETKSNETYKHKLLVVITDGADNSISESLKTQKFFFDNAAFAEYFPAENVFIIDYSEAGSNIFMQKCTSAGCDVYPAENNKQAYLDALDNALQSFKNNWFLIYWTIIIFSLFTIVAMLIQPKKMV